MRKLPMWLLSIAIVALMATACGNGDPAPTDTPTQPPSDTPTPGNGGLVEQGRQAAQAAGCTACHTFDGTQSSGPTWQGLAGSMVTLDDGSTVEADEEFLRESIVDPNAKIVEGFAPNVMPQNYEEQLSEQQIDAIIAFIQSL